MWFYKKMETFKFVEQLLKSQKKMYENEKRNTEPKKSLEAQHVMIKKDEDESQPWIKSSWFFVHFKSKFVSLPTNI